MGWKASAIIIEPQMSLSPVELLNKLGFQDVQTAGSEPFETAVYPGDERIFIGNYAACTIITGDAIVMDFFDSETAMESRLVGLFPDAEICAVSLHSSVNYWGYVVIKDGKRIRERMGDADNGTMLDNGEPLEEELELLSQSVVDEDGIRTYHLKADPSEPYSEDQVGEEFVFEMFRRYTGEPLDRHDDLLYNTRFDAFTVVEPAINLQEPKKSGAQPAQQTAQAVVQPKKVWWKFW